MKSLIHSRRVLIIAFMLYLPLIFFGYGSDVDTYRVLDAGRNFITSGDYIPSRRPGYLVFEMSVFALDQIGGSLLVNLATVFWALVAIDRFLRICQRHGICHAELLALLLAAHPLFWYNATLTNDYIWGMGMLLAGFDWLEQDRYGWAGLAMGLSIGCRLSSFIVVAALILYIWLRLPMRRWQVAGAAVLTIILGSLAYVLPWDFSEWSPSFWKVSAGDEELWSPLMQVGRYLYKNLYFWGPLAGFYLIYLIWRGVRFYQSWAARDGILLVCLSITVVGGIEALFFRFPIEIEYLLPALPFWLLAIGVGVRSKKALQIFLALVVSFGLLTINLARPNQPGQASQAIFGFWVEPGYIIQKMGTRLTLSGCDSHDCYNQRIAPRPVLEDQSH